MDVTPSGAGPDAGENGEKPIAPAAAWAWLSLPPESLLKQCRQSRFQGSGPGGQKRNRVYSGVRLSHAGSGLTGECVDSRASARNVGEALARLRMRLALSAAAAPEPVDPAPGSAFRAGANPDHVDYPRFALRALLLLAGNGGQSAPAAAALACTSSALTRFLKGDKAVWAKAREIRAAHGLHPLK